MSGSFSLSEFITIEMRKYASCRYFCVDRRAITEKDGEFIGALQSFQMMNSARVIADIPGDIHIDKARLPKELKSILENFRNHSVDFTRSADC
jgi:hypothetical protein